MGEVVPGVAVLAVVLADRPPLPLAEIGSPFLPRDLRLARLVQPLLLGDIRQRDHSPTPFYFTRAIFADGWKLRYATLVLAHEGFRRRTARRGGRRGVLLHAAGRRG